MGKHHAKSSPDYVPHASARGLIEALSALGPGLPTLDQSQELADIVAAARSGALDRLSRAEFVAVYRKCIPILGELMRRRDGAGQVLSGPDEFSMLCYCIINCSTLGEAIDRAIRFTRMQEGRKGAVRLEQRGGRATFHQQAEWGWRDVLSFQADLFGLASWHRLFGWLIGENLELLDVAMGYRKATAPAALPSMFGRPIRFAGEDCRFSFDERLLDRPVVRNYRELVALLQAFPHDLQPPDNRALPLSVHVRAIYRAAILEHRPLPVTDELCRMFHISNATFRRRLADEKASVGHLKAECRCEQAARLLRETHATVEEIAHAVGFSDRRAFSDSFRRWSGTMPALYRRQNNPA